MGNISNDTHDPPLGFVVLRHVHDEESNEYWIQCVKSIREYYPKNLILIVDDSSNYEYVTSENLYKTTIIDSEYPKRAELLPYLYYLQNNLFDTAVIIHDSVFVNKHIDFNVDKYKILWEFEHDWDMPSEEAHMLKVFDNAELLKFHENKTSWKGCFGGMTIITHKFLTQLNDKYDLSKLLPFIETRRHRMCFERVIACLLQCEAENETLLGNIHAYMPFFTNFSEAKTHLKGDLPMVKAWALRE
jgi:hypothetical protein